MESIKICKKCLETKAITEFRFRDGWFMGSCKECDRKYARKYNNSDIGKKRGRLFAKSEKRKAWIKKRWAEFGESEHKRELRLKYRRSQKGRETHNRLNKIYKKKYPDKVRAGEKLLHAVRTGKVERKPCEVCGDYGQAHHPDYEKPLEVVWLCSKHHARIHKLQRSNFLLGGLVVH